MTVRILPASNRRVWAERKHTTRHGFVYTQKVTRTAQSICPYGEATFHLRTDIAEIWQFSEEICNVIH